MNHSLSPRKVGAALVLSAALAVAAHGQEKKAEIPPLPQGIVPAVHHSALGQTLLVVPPRLFWNVSQWMDEPSAIVRTRPGAGQTPTAPGAREQMRLQLQRPGRKAPPPKAENKTASPPEPEDSLRAVAAKLRDGGQIPDADAIEQALGNLIAGREAGAVSQILEQLQLRPELAEFKALLAGVTPLQAVDLNLGIRYLNEVESLVNLVSAGLGRKHPKVRALREASLNTLAKLRRSRAAGAPPAAEFKKAEAAWNAAAAKNETAPRDPELAKARRAEPVKIAPGKAGELPWGVAVPGTEGLVYSPCTAERSVVDVSGFEKHSIVKCPYTGRFFRVP